MKLLLLALLLAGCATQTHLNSDRNMAHMSAAELTWELTQ